MKHLTLPDLKYLFDLVQERNAFHRGSDYLRALSNRLKAEIKRENTDGLHKSEQ